MCVLSCVWLQLAVFVYTLSLGVFSRNISKNFPTISWYQKTMLLCSCCIHPLIPHSPTLPLSPSPHLPLSHSPPSTPNPPLLASHSPPIPPSPTPSHSPLINIESTIQFMNPTSVLTHLCVGGCIMSCHVLVFFLRVAGSYTHTCVPPCVVFMLCSCYHHRNILSKCRRELRSSLNSPRCVV